MSRDIGAGTDLEELAFHESERGGIVLMYPTAFLDEFLKYIMSGFNMFLQKQIKQNDFNNFTSSTFANMAIKYIFSTELMVKYQINDNNVISTSTSIGLAENLYDSVPLRQRIRDSFIGIFREDRERNGRPSSAQDFQRRIAQALREAFRVEMSRTVFFRSGDLYDEGRVIFVDRPIRFPREFYIYLDRRLMINLKHIAYTDHDPSEP